MFAGELECRSATNEDVACIIPLLNATLQPLHQLIQALHGKFGKRISTSLHHHFMLEASFMNITVTPWMHYDYIFRIKSYHIFHGDVFWKLYIRFIT